LQRLNKGQKAPPELAKATEGVPLEPTCRRKREKHFLSCVLAYTLTALDQQLPKFNVCLFEFKKYN
jgi:hypothetical protein